MFFSKSHYQPVAYQRLPSEVVQKVDKVLSWLLPDPDPGHPQFSVQVMLDFGGVINGTFRYPKGGSDWLFADWFEENFDSSAAPDTTSSPVSAQALPGGPATLLLTGQRPLETEDGGHYRQSFHLTTGFSGEEITVELSKGEG